MKEVTLKGMEVLHIGYFDLRLKVKRSNLKEGYYIVAEVSTLGLNNITEMTKEEILKIYGVCIKS